MKLDERFWDSAYAEKGYCWGTDPSEFVRQICPIIELYDGILEVGCGYGRDLLCQARCFPRKKFIGVDISSLSLGLMEKLSERLGISAENWETVKCDVTVTLAPLSEIMYKIQCVFCHSLIHLFLKRERIAFLKSFAEISKPGTLLLFSAYSRDDKKFGTGPEVDEGTFKCSKNFPDVEVHFFSKEELIGEIHGTGWSVRNIRTYLEKEQQRDRIEDSLYHLVEAEKVR